MFKQGETDRRTDEQAERERDSERDRKKAELLILVVMGGQCENYPFTTQNVKSEMKQQGVRCLKHFFSSAFLFRQGKLERSAQQVFLTLYCGFN